MGLFDKIKEVKKNQEKAAAQTPDKVFRFNYYRTEVSIKDNIITIDFKFRTKNDENRTKIISLDEIKAIQYKPHNNSTPGFIHFETTNNINQTYNLEDAKNDNTSIVLKFNSDEEDATKLNEYINSLNQEITFLKLNPDIIDEENNQKSCNYELTDDGKRIYNFKSSHNEVILDDDFIAITASCFTNGYLKGVTGTKNIALDEIAGIEFKEPDITVGYFQLIIKGTLEARGGVFESIYDENTVTFTRSEREMALEIKEFIENHKRNKNKPQEHVTSDAQFSVADEILKFKQLLDMGVITQEEFDKKKKELLDM